MAGNRNIFHRSPKFSIDLQFEIVDPQYFSSIPNSKWLIPKIFRRFPTFFIDSKFAIVDSQNFPSIPNFFQRFQIRHHRFSINIVDSKYFPVILNSESTCERPISRAVAGRRRCHSREPVYRTFCPTWSRMLVRERMHGCRSAGRESAATGFSKHRA